MQINERQEEILNKIIEEYIDSAFPISSQLLEKKYDFGISPATIRSEMHLLTERGLLFQPHASAGRVPTDKGYRFFVDELIEQGIFEKNIEKQNSSSKIEKLIEDSEKDTIRFIQSLTKNLSVISSNLVITYLPSEKIFWKEGWEEVLEEPEFKERELVSDLTKFIRNFEKEIEDFKISSEIEIFIGKENPFFKTKEFSIVCAKCSLPQDKEVMISILGPTRMEYEKNINLINSLNKIFEDF